MNLTTRQKIFLAHCVQRPVLLGRRLVRRSPRARVRRRGLNWNLDLREGIDFAIWLQGRFEPSTVAAYRKLIPAGGHVVDIGANIGAHTLNFADAVGPGGRVLACEPTAYAFGCLTENVRLNPGLAPRVDARQVMLLEREDASVPEAVISSWPLEARDVHPTIRGRAQTTDGATAVTLDALVADWSPPKIDLMKLDVDGFECEVLDGAQRTLRDYRPVVFAEVAPHAFEARERDILELLDRFDAAAYRLEAMTGGGEVTRADVEQLRQRGVSANVIARPRDARGGDPPRRQH